MMSGSGDMMFGMWFGWLGMVGLTIVLIVLVFWLVRFLMRQ